MDKKIKASKGALGKLSATKFQASTLRNFPFYEEGKVPQYQKYHADVSYLDELALIWGKRWGAQGIGQLREVAMVRPTEVEVRKLYEEDSAFFVFNGTTPDLHLMQEQHLNLARTYGEARHQGALLLMVGGDPTFGLRAHEAQHFGGRWLRHQWRRHYRARPRPIGAADRVTSRNS